MMRCGSIHRQPATSEHDSVVHRSTPVAALTPLDCHRVFGRDRLSTVGTEDHCFSQRRSRVINQPAEFAGRGIAHLYSAPRHTGCNRRVRTEPSGLRQSNLNRVRREQKDASIILAKAERDLNRITCPFADACVDAVTTEVLQYLHGQALKLSPLVFGRKLLIRVIVMQLALLDVAFAVNDRRSLA